MIVFASSHTAAAEAFLTRIEIVFLFPLMALMTGFAIAVFLWGVFEYVAGADSDEKRTKGRSHILYGVIGLLVMFSAYTILRIATSTFGI